MGFLDVKTFDSTNDKNRQKINVDCDFYEILMDLKLYEEQSTNSAG